MNLQMGIDAPLGSAAKMGATAWGEVEESSGTVLYDGAVTLEDNEGEGVFGQVVEGTLEIGKTINMTLNGSEYSGTVVEIRGMNGVNFLDDAELGLMEQGGAIYLISDYGYASVGENTIKIVQID